MQRVGERRWACGGLQGVLSLAEAGRSDALAAMLAGIRECASVDADTEARVDTEMGLTPPQQHPARDAHRSGSLDAREPWPRPWRLCRAKRCYGDEHS